MRNAQHARNAVMPKFFLFCPALQHPFSIQITFFYIFTHVLTTLKFPPMLSNCVFYSFANTASPD